MTAPSKPSSHRLPPRTPGDSKPNARLDKRKPANVKTKSVAEGAFASPRSGKSGSARSIKGGKEPLSGKENKTQEVADGVLRSKRSGGDAHEDLVSPQSGKSGSARRLTENKADQLRRKKIAADQAARAAGKSPVRGASFGRHPAISTTKSNTAETPNPNRKLNLPPLPSQVSNVVARLTQPRKHKENVEEKTETETPKQPSRASRRDRDTPSAGARVRRTNSAPSKIRGAPSKERNVEPLSGNFRKNLKKAAVLTNQKHPPQKKAAAKTKQAAPPKQTPSLNSELALAPPAPAEQKAKEQPPILIAGGGKKKKKPSSDGTNMEAASAVVAAESSVSNAPEVSEAEQLPPALLAPTEPPPESPPPPDLVNFEEQPFPVIETPPLLPPHLQALREQEQESAAAFRHLMRFVLCPPEDEMNAAVVNKLLKAENKWLPVRMFGEDVSFLQTNGNIQTINKSEIEQRYKKLNLSGWDITSQEFRDVVNLISESPLEQVTFFYNHALRGEDLQALKGLTSLHISHCQSLDLPSITSLIERCPNLRKIEINGYYINDSLIEALATCPELSDIDLSHCILLDGINLEPLFKKPSLETLNLTGVAISSFQIENFKEQNPKVQVIQANPDLKLSTPILHAASRITPHLTIPSKNEIAEKHAEMIQEIYPGILSLLQNGRRPPDFQKYYEEQELRSHISFPEFCQKQMHLHGFDIAQTEIDCSKLTLDQWEAYVQAAVICHNLMVRLSGNLPLFPESLPLNFFTILANGFLRDRFNALKINDLGLPCIPKVLLEAYFRNVTEIDLQLNYLMEIPTFFAPSLEQYYLSSNEISSDEHAENLFEKCPKIKLLLLNSNHITSFPWQLIQSVCHLPSRMSATPFPRDEEEVEKAIDAWRPSVQINLQKNPISGDVPPKITESHFYLAKSLGEDPRNTSPYVPSLTQKFFDWYNQNLLKYLPEVAVFVDSEPFLENVRKLKGG